jgi:hypothetical protein
LWWRFVRPAPQEHLRGNGDQAAASDGHFFSGAANAPEIGTPGAFSWQGGDRPLFRTAHTIKVQYHVLAGTNVEFLSLTRFAMELCEREPAPRDGRAADAHHLPRLGRNRVGEHRGERSPRCGSRGAA